MGLIDPSTDGGPSRPLFGCEGISLRLAGRQILGCGAIGAVLQLTVV